MTAALQADRRRAETHAAVRHRAHIIHATVGGPRTSGCSAPVRQAARKRAESIGLGLRVTRRLVDLLGVVDGPDAQKGVLRLVQTASFTALAAELQDTLLQRLTHQRPTTKHIDAVAACLHGGGVARLDPSAQPRAVAAATDDDALMVRHLPELVDSPGLAELSPPEQRDVLGYFVGPRLARDVAPMRKTRIRLMWNVGRQALLTHIRRPARAPEVQADTLRSFLNAPTQPLNVLNATALNGHAVVVFGNPDDPSALSYGRRWVAAPGRLPQPRLYTPDPTVGSGWTKPAMDARTPYSGCSYRLSRLEAWRLIGWIESSFVVSDDRRAMGLGPNPLGGDTKRFIDAFEQALAGLIADANRARGARQWYLAGQPHDPTDDDDSDDANAMLAAFLKR